MFPPDLKLADVNPVYKKISKNSKDNYRSVSILSTISKIYERCLYDQIQVFFDSILSKYQCGFRRDHDKYSSWSEILFGVPQGSILGLYSSTFLYVTCFIISQTDQHFFCFTGILENIYFYFFVFYISFSN